MERSWWPRIRWCGTGGFQELGQCIFIDSYSLPFCLLLFSLPLLSLYGLWICGVGVFGLIGCYSLSPSLALPTFFNTNNKRPYQCFILHCRALEIHDEINVKCISSSHYPFAIIQGTCTIISAVAHFFSLPQQRLVTTSRPSSGDKPIECQGLSEITQELTKQKCPRRSQSSIHIHCTRAFHSFLSFAHCRAASVIPLLPKTTFTPSIQSNPV